MILDSEEILRTFINYFNTTPRNIFRNTRKAEVLDIRQMYYHFCRKYTILTFNDIGKIGCYYGGKVQNHATVLHANNKIIDLITVDKEFKRRYDEIENSLVEDYSYNIISSIIPNKIDLLTLTKRNQLI